LTWIYERHEDELPLSTGELYEKFEEEKEYTGSKAAYSKMLGKLKDKGLLEKPEYGQYDLSDRGLKKAKYLLGERDDVPENRPEDYGEVIHRLQDFVLAEKEKQIRQDLLKTGEVHLQLSELDNFDPLIVDYLEENPTSFFDAFDEAIGMFEADIESINYNFIPDVEHLEVDVAEANTSKNLGKALVIEGIVKKSESVKQEIVSAVFECVQCGDRYEKKQESAQLKSPYKCDCGSKKFDTLSKNLTDSVSITLSSRQETETTIHAKLTGDIGKKKQQDMITGSRLRILGKTREVAISKKSAKHQTVVDILSYENLDRKRKEQDFSKERIREVRKRMQESDKPFEDFALSLAPHLGDLEIPKKCVAASLIGSPRVETEDEIDYGRIHTAIIANPGLGKSAIQEWVEEKFNNTFLATGERGSGSGLTASIEKTEGGQWELVAGKVVFADKGILGVDEFDKFDEGELVKLNSSMERGQISVDLATESADLNARATIIASGNFKHPPDDFTEARELLPEKGQGLYDRFALMCGVTDQDSSKVHDTMASRYIKDNDRDELNTVQSDDKVFEDEELLIFQKIAQEQNPVMTSKSYYELSDYVSDSDGSSIQEEGSSNRFLKHLIKLTLCFARCNLREEATVPDAVKAINLMKECRHSIGFESGDPSFEVWERNHKKKMKKTIEENYNGDEMAEIQDVIDNAKVGDSKAEELLEKLKKDGEAHVPQQGYVALI